MLLFALSCFHSFCLYHRCNFMLASSRVKKQEKVLPKETALCEERKDGLKNNYSGLGVGKLESWKGCHCACTFHKHRPLLSPLLDATHSGEPGMRKPFPFPQESYSSVITFQAFSQISLLFTVFSRRQMTFRHSYKVVSSVKQDNFIIIIRLSSTDFPSKNYQDQRWRLKNGVSQHFNEMLFKLMSMGGEKYQVCLIAREFNQVTSERKNPKCTSFGHKVLQN